MKLDQQQLFFHLFSTILGLVHNDAISKDPNCCASYLEKCFTFLLSDKSKCQYQHQYWYHHYGINYLASVLLNNLSTSKDGLENILCNSYYANFYNAIQSVSGKLTQPIYLFLSLDSLCHVTNSLSQSLNLCMSSSCHADLIKLYSKFMYLNYVDLLKSALLELDKCFEDGNESGLEKHCYQRADIVLKHLVKISKMVKCIKSYCDDGNQNKGQTSSFAPKSHLMKENLTSKLSGRKHVSSDDEPMQKPVKHFNNSNNQSEEESAENMSDFNDLLFDESSDSGVERRVKEKNTSKKSETQLSKKGIPLLVAVNTKRENVYLIIWIT